MIFNYTLISEFTNSCVQGLMEVGGGLGFVLGPPIGGLLYGVG